MMLHFENAKAGLKLRGRSPGIGRSLELFPCVLITISKCCNTMLHSYRGGLGDDLEYLGCIPKDQGLKLAVGRTRQQQIYLINTDTSPFINVSL